MSLVCMGVLTERWVTLIIVCVVYEGRQKCTLYTFICYCGQDYYSLTT